MKKYEVLTVYKASLDLEEVDKNLEKLEEVVASLEGKIESTDKMGRRRLAYEIKKFNDGYFVNQIIALPADKTKDLRRSLRLNENILRTMILDVTEKAAIK